MKNTNLTLYGASWCGYCVTLAHKLSSRNIAFNYKNVDDPDVRLEMNKKTNGNHTIPVLCKGNDCYVNPDEQTLKGVLNV